MNNSLICMRLQIAQASSITRFKLMKPSEHVEKRIVKISTGLGIEALPSRNYR